MQTRAQRSRRSKSVAGDQETSKIDSKLTEEEITMLLEYEVRPNRRETHTKLEIDDEEKTIDLTTEKVVEKEEKTAESVDT